MPLKFSKLFICFSILFCLVQAKSTGNGDEDSFPLTIVHLNDIHSHFEEVSVDTGRCHTDQARENKCYGGIARMFTKIKRLRETETNVLLLNAGDYYQGTIWYTLFKYRPVVEFGNLLNYTAMGLGNHDLDDKIAGLKPFTELANYDILAANVVETADKSGKTPVLGKGIKKSKVISVDGVKIGIIGYITNTTAFISSGGPTLSFLDEIESVAAEAKRLKSEEDVHILIALGHAGYREIDLKMAENISEIDLVVGGHSHTFLYPPGANPPSTEKPEGPYPTYVTQKETGRVVPVVQAFCFSKYMGRLNLRFDDQGELLVPVEGRGVSQAEVILLDGSIEKDPSVEKAMGKYRQNMTKYYEVIGTNEIPLVHKEWKENNIGNVITDSMVEAWKGKGKGKATIGFINNGGMRANLVEGEVTGEDVYNILPYGNTVDRLAMNGSGIMDVLEDYAAQICADKDCFLGGFLQVSGLKVVYDVKEDNAGRRVTKAETRCEDGISWCPLEMEKIYFVVTISFLAKVKSKQNSFPDHIIEREKGMSDYDALVGYIKAHTPINQEVEGRMR